jgi:hypothetical protein
MLAQLGAQLGSVVIRLAVVAHVVYAYPEATVGRSALAVPPILRSALAAEQQAERFARAGGRGVVLRLELLDGPGTGDYGPLAEFGATLHVSDAGSALLSALSLPSGIYNVCRDGRVSRRSASPEPPGGIRSRAVTDGGRQTLAGSSLSAATAVWRSAQSSA